jgi:hypothetical protein
MTCQLLPKPSTTTVVKEILEIAHIGGACILGTNGVRRKGARAGRLAQPKAHPAWRKPRAL